MHLAERGYVVLAPDYVHSGGYKFDPYDNGFVSATMLGIWNHRVGLDLLQSLPEVDGDGALVRDDLSQPMETGAMEQIIDANGNIVDPTLDERTLGVSLDTLRQAETAILVVAGAAKHDIARAVVTSGLCSVLITDEATARDLLEES